MFRLASWLFGLLIRLLFYLIFYGTPLIGFWLASSLAAYLGGPPWIAWVAGLLMFPVIPGIWELRAYAYRSPESKPWFSTLDRLSLRTFAVGLAFLAVMLYAFPQTAFVSLSTRGDWMLDEVKDSRADTARRVLFRAAGALEWLYRATKTNPYKAHVDSEARQRSEEATKQLEQEAAQQREKEAAQTGKADQPSETESALKHENEAQQPAQPELKWPWKGATLHPAVSKMPASAETSIESVARYIAKHESDPILRIKALHDYVADRVAYDSQALYSGNIPDQDAQSVFNSRKSVCAGYANLLSALAAAIGEKGVVVTGDARDEVTDDKLTGIGHAWNAARIGQHWYLIDACWDSGYVSREKGFTKRYKIDYFLPPPEVMIQDHFPEEPNWQLLAKPLSQGEFLRQPMLNPSFQAADLRLISPRRARIEAGSEAMVIVKNPQNQWLMAGLEQNGKEVGPSSDPTNSETAQLVCPLPDKGTYRLNMFVNEHQQREGDYEFVGSVDFVNR